MLLKKTIVGGLVGCLLGGLPAAAQTGRIAHYSHGGSAVTLVSEQATADNFGEPMPYFVPDSVRFLSARLALSYGKWHWGGNGSTTDTLRFPEAYSPQQAAKYTRQLYTRAKLIGFDSVGSPRRAAPAAEQPTKGKRRRKSASVRAPRPAAPGLPLGALVVVALAGGGWLLGSKTQPAPPRRS